MATTRRSIRRSVKTRERIDDLYVLTKPLNREHKIVLDIKDIISFCFCPFYQDLRNSVDNEVNYKELYDRSLHNTFYAYLRSLQEGGLDGTLKTLKYYWGKEWIRYKTTKDILVAPSSVHRDYYENGRRKGINAIYNFDEIMSDQRQLPIIIGHKYEYEILPDIILTGTFEYVRELTLDDETKIIQLVKFISESNRFSTNIAKENDLELIAASYVFDKLFQTPYFQSVSIDIMAKKMMTCNYNKNDYNLLLNTIKSVVICMQNNIKCISPDQRCFHCEYRNICKNLI